MPKASTGDTLSGIADQYGTTVAQILADNPVLAARAEAGQTVLYNGTTFRITQPNTSTNPYGPTVSGANAGMGTASVPIGPSSPVDTTTLAGIAAASGLSYDPLTGKIGGVGNPMSSWRWNRCNWRNWRN